MLCWFVTLRKCAEIQLKLTQSTTEAYISVSVSNNKNNKYLNIRKIINGRKMCLISVETCCESVPSSLLSGSLRHRGLCEAERRRRQSPADREGCGGVQQAGQPGRQGGRGLPLHLLMDDDGFPPCCTDRDVLHYTEDSLEFTFTHSLCFTLLALSFSQHDYRAVWNQLEVDGPLYQHRFGFRRANRNVLKSINQ